MKFKVLSVSSLVAGIMTFGSVAWCQTFVGTILATHGDVKILHVPLPSDAGPYAQMKGVKYAYHKAKIGDKVNPGEVILCGADGKAKIVYPNGDSFFIGNGSSLILPSVAKNTSDGNNSVVKMFYGRFRALISKKGPRNRLRVVTPDAIAGVRGTDFFTRANASVGTQLTVLRGEVLLQNTATPSQNVAVKTGFEGFANKKSTTPQEKEATREELSQLQEESAVQANPKQVAALPVPEQKEIHILDEKAREVALSDIHDRDPALYTQLQKSKPASVDQINASVVAQLVKTAPSVVKHKPTLQELESSGKGVYKKYFDKRNKKK